mmetsp:Transcript_7339/g.18040  ORF Transcript_7339/g.18040 Transcript_7339/m.18040 type:complete len:283 (-) Transcript_7339:623-1471(-)
MGDRGGVHQKHSYPATNLRILPDPAVAGEFKSGRPEAGDRMPATAEVLAYSTMSPSFAASSPACSKALSISWAFTTALPKISGRPGVEGAAGPGVLRDGGLGAADAGEPNATECRRSSSLRRRRDSWAACSKTPDLCEFPGVPKLAADRDWGDGLGTGLGMGDPRSSDSVAAERGCQRMEGHAAPSVSLRSGDSSSGAHRRYDGVGRSRCRGTPTGGAGENSKCFGLDGRDGDDGGRWPVDRCGTGGPGATRGGGDRSYSSTSADCMLSVGASHTGCPTPAR